MNDDSILIALLRVRQDRVGTIEAVRMLITCVFNSIVHLNAAVLSHGSRNQSYIRVVKSVNSKILPDYTARRNF